MHIENTRKCIFKNILYKIKIERVLVVKRVEKTIKSKERVKKHGEVFTPANIVNDMLNLPGLKECIKEFTTTVLEPSCGEGIFIIEILKKRLKKVREKSGNDIVIYENLALLSLTTLYGIELLEDNAQKCVINIYEVFISDYTNFAKENKRRVKRKVLDSAKTIITANIVEGNFLTRKTASGVPIIFSEWKIIKPRINRKNLKHIKIARTEYSIDEILNQESHSPGTIYGSNVEHRVSHEQKMLFELLNEKIEEKKYRYKIVKLIDVNNEEVEEIVDGDR